MIRNGSRGRGFRAVRHGAPALACALLLGIWGSAAAPSRADEPRLTNLGLLDRLTGQAIDQVLDSLGVEPGDTYAVIARDYHEGNRFVADAFARALTRRGCEVHLLDDLPAAEISAPGGGPAKPGPGAPAEAPDGEETGLLDDFFAQQDPFAPDSAEAEADSIDWIALADSLAGVPQEEEEEEAREEAEEAPGEEASEEETGPARKPPAAVASRRAYPPGSTLEFRILEFAVGYPAVKRSFGLVGSPTVRRIGGVYLQTARIEGPDGKIEAMATGQSHHEDLLDNRSRLRAEGASYPFRAPEIPAARAGRLVEPIVVLGIIGSLVYLFYQNQN